MNFKTTLRRLIEFFGKEKIDYALIGAFAMKAYGYMRATQDIDFLVRREDQVKIIAHLESLGYETLYRSTGFSNHLHLIHSLGRIDLVYVDGDTADTILSQTRSLLLLEGVSVPVVRAEHLVALKVFAMKNDPERYFQEMADIQYLLTLPGIDLEEVKRYFEKFGQLDRYYDLTRGKNERSEP